MASVTLKCIKKVYDKSVVAVQDMDLEIADKEFVVLVGPSGCGKSTTLRMIAGLEEITAGDLYIGDRRVNNVEPRDRNIAMVFQNYALYPHMTVYDNISFGLRMRHMPRKLIDEKVRAAAETLEITDLLKRKPKALSGGQRQRVAIGRAIVRDPDVFLMDEPLSNLDAKLRGQMRTELIKLRRRLDTTFVYVTHDQTEAMTLGDRIVIMDKGKVMQVGTPQEVFDRPANTFVAGFIGTPQMNFLKAGLCAEGTKRYILYGDERIELPGSFPEEYSRREVTVGIRPEHIAVSESEGLPALVEVSELMGSTVDLHVRVGEDVLEAVIPSTQARLLPKPDPASGVAPIVRLRLEADHLHLFDPESGDRIEPEQMETSVPAPSAQ